MAKPPWRRLGSARLAGTHPVEVVEGGAELVELLLADAFGVPCQDLVLDLVDGAGDRGEQLFPAHTDVLRRGDMGGGKEVKREV